MYVFFDLDYYEYFEYKVFGNLIDIRKFIKICLDLLINV